MTMKRFSLFICAWIICTSLFGQNSSRQSMTDGIYKYLNLDGQFKPVKTADGNVMIDCGTSEFPRQYYIHVSDPIRDVFPISLTSYVQYDGDVTPELLTYNLHALSLRYPYVKCLVSDDMYSLSVSSFVLDLIQLQKGVLDVMRQELDAVMGGYRNVLEKPTLLQEVQFSPDVKRSPVITKSLHIPSSQLSIDFVLVEPSSSPAFYVANSEISAEIWKAVMGEDVKCEKDRKTGNDIALVTYEQILHFIQALNDMTGLEFHIPSDTEWENTRKLNSHDHLNINGLGNGIYEQCSDIKYLDVNGVTIEAGRNVRDEQKQTGLASKYGSAFRLVISKEDFE